MTVVRDQLFPQNPPGSRLRFSRTGVQPSPGSSKIELPSAFTESGAYPPERALPGSPRQCSLPSSPICRSGHGSQPHGGFSLIRQKTEKESTNTNGDRSRDGTQKRQRARGGGGRGERESPGTYEVMVERTVGRKT